MKKTLIICIFCFILVYSTGCYVFNNVYSRSARVEQVNDGIITFIDRTGNEWEYEKEDDKLVKMGQKVKLIMNTKGTEEVEDDIIIKVRW